MAILSQIMPILSALFIGCIVGLGHAGSLGGPNKMLKLPAVFIDYIVGLGHAGSLGGPNKMLKLPAVAKLPLHCPG